MTTAERIVKLMAQIAKEEAWLDHYMSIGVAAPKQEEIVAQLRYELASLREKAGMRS